MRYAASIAFLVLSGANLARAGTPVFSGNVEDDFNLPQALVMVDQNGIPDVGFPPDFPPDTEVGFEIIDLRLVYDRLADILYVGMNYLGIAGDVDGDGDPGNTGPILAGLGGMDLPSFGGTESFVVGFDTNSDGIPEVVCGVDAFNDITGFTAAIAINAPTPSLAFGDALPMHTGSLFMDPDAESPDIEFTVPRFSELPGFNILDRSRQTLKFRVSAFSGALGDLIGEDFVLPHEIVLGKNGFDLDLQDGALVTDQFLLEGLTITGHSYCGTPGVFVNDPADDPTTDDIIPDTPPFVLTTICARGDDSSDAGTMTFKYINPIDLSSPAGAVFVALTFLDIEDSGFPGRATSRLQLFAREDGSVIADLPIPSGPNGGQFPVSFPTFGRGEFFRPISEVRAAIGDDDDSGGVDTLCYNLEPCLLDLRLQVGSPTGEVRGGDRVSLPVTIESVSDRRVEAIGVVVVRRRGNKRERILEEPRLIRFRPHFSNSEDPVMLSFRVPDDLGPRAGRRPLEISAKLLHPTSGVILAQAVVDLPMKTE